MIIPARDEAGNIEHVVQGFLSLQREGIPAIGEIVVVDNSSKDDTSLLACAAGATVVSEPLRGYGRACLRGLGYLAQRPAGPPDVVVFADGNASTEPAELEKLLAPIEASEAHFVLGVRPRMAARGAVSVQQRFGNWLACFMIKCLYGTKYSDLAPFRAIAWESLTQLGMNDLTYGWSIEMQVKAAKQGLKIREVEVRTYPRMAGRSKVSGTIRGVFGAGWKIITTILRYR